MADAGPLIALARAGHLRTLRKVAGTVLVPQQVARECLREPSRPGAHAIRRGFRDGVLTRKSLGKSELYDALLSLVGDGEAACIALAQALGVPALLDDMHARRIARRMGVTVLGTGGVLVRAKASGLIPAVKPILLELRRNGYRFSDELVSEILVRCSERQ